MSGRLPLQSLTEALIMTSTSCALGPMPTRTSDGVTSSLRQVAKSQCRILTESPLVSAVSTTGDSSRMAPSSTYSNTSPSPLRRAAVRSPGASATWSRFANYDGK